MKTSQHSRATLRRMSPRTMATVRIVEGELLALTRV
jgi:hypothetical protein